MSNVNADATQLLTILKNMRTSISSIETTRSSVKMKYQQLGIGWNDKKYDELGTIVKDCNKALNDILQIMLQAEKYVRRNVPGCLRRSKRYKKSRYKTSSCPAGSICFR